MLILECPCGAMLKVNSIQIGQGTFDECPACRKELPQALRRLISWLPQVEAGASGWRCCIDLGNMLSWKATLRARPEPEARP